MTENKDILDHQQEQTTPPAFKEGPLKQVLVDYVGSRKCLNSESEQVSLEMIVEVFADEFPEVVLAIAEANFYRGYQQALDDADHVRKERNRLEQEPPLGIHRTTEKSE